MHLPVPLAASGIQVPPASLRVTSFPRVTSSQYLILQTVWHSLTAFYPPSSATSYRIIISVGCDYFVLHYSGSFLFSILVLWILIGFSCPILDIAFYIEF